MYMCRVKKCLLTSEVKSDQKLPNCPLTGQKKYAPGRKSVGASYSEVLRTRSTCLGYEDGQPQLTGVDSPRPGCVLRSLLADERKTLDTTPNRTNPKGRVCEEK